MWLELGPADRVVPAAETAASGAAVALALTAAALEDAAGAGVGSPCLQPASTRTAMADNARVQFITAKMPRHRAQLKPEAALLFRSAHPELRLTHKYGMLAR